MSPSVFMAELTQGTAHQHDSIPIKILSSECSRMITEHSHPALQKCTQNEICLSSACNGTVGRAAPDCLCPKLDTGRQKGSNDSERNDHSPGPYRPHLLQKTITATQQPPEELGVAGRKGNRPHRPHKKSNYDYDLAYMMVTYIDQYILL